MEQWRNQLKWNDNCYYPRLWALVGRVTFQWKWLEIGFNAPRPEKHIFRWLFRWIIMIWDQVRNNTTHSPKQIFCPVYMPENAEKTRSYTCFFGSPVFLERLIWLVFYTPFECHFHTLVNRIQKLTAKLDHWKKIWSKWMPTLRPPANNGNENLEPRYSWITFKTL